MKTAPAWDDIAAFLSVMRTGSLSAAARELGLAQPTVRQRIEALEGALGCVLFSRSRTGLAPTDAARQALAYAETMAASAEALQRATSGLEDAGASGTVRLTASEVMAFEVLPPILAEFRRKYPAVEIELSATDLTEDLVRRDADIAVRMTRPRQSALIARHVGDIEMGLFAHPALLQVFDTPCSLADLKTLPLVGEEGEGAILEGLNAQGAGLGLRNFVLRTGSGPAQLGAIRAGVGAGLCQAPLAARAHPPLVRLLPELSFGLPVFLVMHEDLKPVKRIRRLFDHLAAQLGDYVDR